MHPTSVQTGPKHVDDIIISVDLDIHTALAILEHAVSTGKTNLAMLLIAELKAAV